MSFNVNILYKHQHTTQYISELKKDIEFLKRLVLQKEIIARTNPSNNQAFKDFNATMETKETLEAIFYQKMQENHSKSVTELSHNPSPLDTPTHISLQPLSTSSVKTSENTSSEILNQYLEENIDADVLGQLEEEFSHNTDALMNHSSIDNNSNKIQGLVQKWDFIPLQNQTTNQKPMKTLAPKKTTNAEGFTKDSIYIGLLLKNPKKSFISQYCNDLDQLYDSFVSNENNFKKIQQKVNIAEAEGLEMIDYGFQMETSEIDPVYYTVFYLLYFAKLDNK